MKKKKGLQNPPVTAEQSAAQDRQDQGHTNHDPIRPLSELKAAKLDKIRELTGKRMGLESQKAAADKDLGAKIKNIDAEIFKLLNQDDSQYELNLEEETSESSLRA